jgi:hypothetical protein
MAARIQAAMLLLLLDLVVCTLAAMVERSIRRGPTAEASRALHLPAVAILTSPPWLICECMQLWFHGASHLVTIRSGPD